MIVANETALLTGTARVATVSRHERVSYFKKFNFHLLHHGYHAPFSRIRSHFTRGCGHGLGQGRLPALQSTHQ